MRVIIGLIIIVNIILQIVEATTKTTISTTTAKPTTIISLYSGTTVSTNEDVSISSEEVENSTDVLLSTCEVNSSCILSSEKPNMTTIKPNVTMQSKPIAVVKKYSVMKHGTFRNKNFCTCDLQLNYCDINCCCDDDCSDDDKLVFDHCEIEHWHFDTRYCEYMKYIYINNTPFEWHINQNGLFCVLKRNLPPSYSVQKQDPIESFVEANKEKVNKFSWSKYGHVGVLKFNDSQNFVYGSNIWIVNGNGISSFKLPNKFISTRCMIMEDVFNMINVDNICTRTDMSENNPHLSFSTYFNQFYLIAAPKFINLAKYKNGIFKDCPRNVCLELVPKICDESYENCEVISRNDSRVNVSCNFDRTYRRNTCRNVVKVLLYNFHHNGTGGFSKIETLAILENVSYTINARIFELAQEFSVRFWWHNQVNNYSAMLSGNPGYLLGKPLLIGKFRNVGNKSQPLLRIERDPYHFLGNFFTVTDNVKGICVRNNKTYLPIEFGYNMITKCKLKSSVEISKNATQSCKTVQEMIFDLWGISEGNTSVGMFGNADPNSLDSWVRILYERSPSYFLNKNTGQFSVENKIVHCFGIATQLEISIFHSKIDMKSLKNQEKILAVVVSFTNLVNKSFDIKNHLTAIELDLTTQVVFYDISEEAQYKFIDPPTLEIKLPYDFFYPFVRINNGVSYIKPKWNPMWVFLLILTCWT